jgi:hypothetical protein
LDCKVSASMPLPLHSTLSLCTAHMPLPLPSNLVWLAAHCRIEQVQRNKDQITKIKFKNAEGKYSTHYFTFAHVLTTFKPVNGLP